MRKFGSILNSQTLIASQERNFVLVITHKAYSGFEVKGMTAEVQMVL